MNLFLTMMGPPGARAFASTLPDKGHPLACSIPRARTFFEPPRCVVNFDKPCGFYRGTSYQAGTTWEIRLEYTGFCGSLMLYIYFFFWYGLLGPTCAAWFSRGLPLVLDGGSGNPSYFLPFFQGHWSCSFPEAWNHWRSRCAFSSEPSPFGFNGLGFGASEGSCNSG